MKATPEQIKTLKISKKQYKFMTSAGFHVTDFLTPKSEYVQWQRGDIFLVFCAKKQITPEVFTQYLIQQVYYKSNQAIRHHMTIPSPDDVCFKYKND